MNASVDTGEVRIEGFLPFRRLQVANGFVGAGDAHVVDENIDLAMRG